jgi:hypothetical protein
VHPLPRVPVLRDRGEDVCPSCSARLGAGRGHTRRLALLSPVPGTFVWQCPDCRGVWQTAPRSPLRPLAT